MSIDNPGEEDIVPCPVCGHDMHILTLSQEKCVFNMTMKEIKDIISFAYKNGYGEKNV